MSFNLFKIHRTLSQSKGVVFANACWLPTGLFSQNLYYFASFDVFCVAPLAKICLQYLRPMNANDVRSFNALATISNSRNIKVVISLEDRDHLACCLIQNNIEPEYFSPIALYGLHCLEWFWGIYETRPVSTKIGKPLDTDVNGQCTDVFWSGYCLIVVS